MEKQNRKFDLIIFDFDGVLVEFRWEWIYEGYLDVLKEAGINPNPFFNNLDEFRGGTWGGKNDGRSNFKLLGIKDTAKAYKVYYDSYNRNIQILPYVEDLLVNLRKAGYILTIMTNRHAYNTRVLLGNLTWHFREIIGAEHVSKFKPDPEGINLILKKLGVKKEKTVMLGDSFFDIVAGKTAGIKTGAVIWQYGGQGLMGDLMNHGTEELIKPDFIIAKEKHFYNLFL